MAEPGDPDRPDDEETPKGARPAGHDWDDDHVGFASPASLTPQSVRAPEPEPEPAPTPAPEPVFAPSEPDLFAAPIPAPEPERPRASAPMPDWAVETPTPNRTPLNVPGAMNLYANYALILFSVPTLGVSAVIGLLAVTGREAPIDPIARSHFIYQQRTLWAAAVVALLGAILIVVNIGVFVLFALSLWMLARGAVGVLRLKAGQPIPNPRHWLF